MPRFFYALAVLAMTTAASSTDAAAQQHLAPWQPSPGHWQIPIWPGAAPNPVVYDGPEYSVKVEDGLVAGKPWISEERVTVPTMTVYAPKAANSGAAIIVFPGGGYQVLAMDLEGTEICDWLVTRHHMRALEVSRSRLNEAAQVRGLSPSSASSGRRTEDDQPDPASCC